MKRWIRYVKSVSFGLRWEFHVFPEKVSLLGLKPKSWVI